MRSAAKLLRPAEAARLLKAPTDACLESSSDGLSNILKAYSGVGDAKAKAAIKVFGDEALEMIRKKDERLLTVPGFGPRVLDKLQSDANSNGRNLNAKGHAFALSLGLSRSNAIKLAEEYEEKTEHVVRRDPYCLLAHFPRLGFSCVDDIARDKLGASIYAPTRAAAALLVRLRHIETDGHCYDPRGLLLDAAQRTMLLPTTTPALTNKAASEGLDRLMRMKQTVLVGKDVLVYYRPIMLKVRVAFG